MNKKKFMSLILALVMILGAFSPLTAMAEQTVKVENGKVVPPTGKIDATEQLSETKPEKTEIDIYKLTTKQNYKTGAPWEHTGGKIDSKDYTNLGDGVEALVGAKFTFYKINGTDDVENEKILALLDKNKNNFKTVDDMAKLLTGGAGATGLTASEKDATLTEITAGKLAKVEDSTATGLTNGETGATGTDGKTTVSLPDGYYWVIESKIPDKVTGQIAVPFGLTLPLMNPVKVGTVEAGKQYMKKIYIYPKNIQTDDVQIDKDHANYDNKTGKWYDKDGVEVPSSKLGIDYTNYQRKKDTVSRELGQDSPFQSDTTIPRNYTFDSFSWVDTMSEGLTYNKDVVVTIDYTDADGKTIQKNQPFINSQNKADYVTERDNGFEIKVTKAQVKDTLVEYLTRGPVTFHFSYSAKVNNSAVVDKPQSNSITFKPGEPGGVPDVKSKEGKIEIVKSWKKNKENVTNPTAADLTYYVEDSTGKTVASVTVKSDATAGTVIQAANGITFTVGATFGSGTFAGLPEVSYKVREAVNGYEPAYTPDNANGKLTIVNNDKPEVKKPSEPTVEFHGKKFVKTDQLNNKERLFGAEFVIKNNSDDANNQNKGKFLVVKSNDTKIAEVQDVKNAKKALDDEIAKYNALTGEEQKKQKAKYDTKIDELQKAYNDAVIKARTTFTWEAGDAQGNPPADAYKLVSDGQGRFEITGLSAGKYQLVEITAPVGYAKLDGPVDFEVKEGTYAGDSAKELQYNKDYAKGGYGKEVKNKKYTIPQTGGIGTVIFTVVGIGLMAGAFIAMRKRTAEEN